MLGVNGLLNVKMLTTHYVWFFAPTFTGCGFRFVVPGLVNIDMSLARRLSAHGRRTVLFLKLQTKVWIMGNVQSGKESSFRVPTSPY